MSQAQNKKAPKQTSNQPTDGTVEVLYQRLGNKWFAFSLIDDEVFVGSVPEEAIASDASSDPTFGQEGNS
jgi:hypothetical protein